MTLMKCPFCSQVARNRRFRLAGNLARSPLPGRSARQSCGRPTPRQGGRPLASSQGQRAEQPGAGSSGGPGGQDPARSHTRQEVGPHPHLLLHCPDTIFFLEISW